MGGRTRLALAQDLRAFHAEPNSINRDEIAARQRLPSGSTTPAGYQAGTAGALGRWIKFYLNAARCQAKLLMMKRTSEVDGGVVWPAAQFAYQFADGHACGIGCWRVRNSWSYSLIPALLGF
jgi:hypothetical protein